MIPGSLRVVGWGVSRGSLSRYRIWWAFPFGLWFRKTLGPSCHLSLPSALGSWPVWAQGVLQELGPRRLG